MPRTARASLGGICCHAMNRGNGGATVFHKDADYRAFLRLIRQAGERVKMRVLGYCLMPNHFHVVLWPIEDGDLGRWMQWLLTSHVRRYHKHYGTSGHVWQGRFKAFPSQDGVHLLTVLRYAERNPVRANLVTGAEEWPWSSFRQRVGLEGPVPLERGPVPIPDDWPEWVQRPMSDKELDAMRRSVNRGTPWGDDEWVRQAAKRMGLEASLRSRGRPRKS